MTYWGLNSYFLGAAVVVGVVALAVHARRQRRAGLPANRLRRLSWVVAIAILLAMTAVFDNVMIGIGLVGYDAHEISGVFVGIAPLEDFSYAVGALILLPSLWALLPATRTGHASAPASTSEDERARDAR